MSERVESGSKSFSPVGHLGLYPVVILIGANLRAPITSLGPVLNDIQRDLHLDGLGAGLLNALPLLVFAVLSLVAPLLGRRHGLERVLALAVLAIFLGTIIRSLQGEGMVWLGTLLLSAGIAFGNVLLPGLVKREFPERATGLIGRYAAAMAGMAGLAAGLAVPIAHIQGSGWRWSIGCWASIAFVTFCVLVPHIGHRQPRLTDAARAPRQKSRSPWVHPIGWQVSVFFAAHSLIFYALVDWYASYAMAKGIAASIAGLHLLIYQVVAVATNLSMASLIRRSRDQRLPGFACGSALLIGTSGLLFAPAFALLWLIFAGLGAGAAMVMSLSLFALRTRDHFQATNLSSMAQFIGYIGAAAGPLLVGMLNDISHGWTLPLLFLSAISVLVTIFATLAGRKRFID